MSSTRAPGSEYAWFEFIREYILRREVDALEITEAGRVRYRRKSDAEAREDLLSEAWKIFPTWEELTPEARKGYEKMAASRDAIYLDRKNKNRERVHVYRRDATSTRATGIELGFKALDICGQPDCETFFRRERLDEQRTRVNRAAERFHDQTSNMGEGFLVLDIYVPSYDDPLFQQERLEQEARKVDRAAKRVAAQTSTMGPGFGVMSAYGEPRSRACLPQGMASKELHYLVWSCGDPISSARVVATGERILKSM